MSDKRIKPVLNGSAETMSSYAYRFVTWLPVMKRLAQKILIFEKINRKERLNTEIENDDK